MTDKPESEILNKVDELSRYLKEVLEPGLKQGYSCQENAGEDSARCLAVDKIRGIYDIINSLKQEGGKNDIAGQLESVSNELANTYEELVLLHKMSSNMKVTKSDSKYLQMACDELTKVVDMEGIAVLLKKEVDGLSQLKLAAGVGLVTIPEDIYDLLENRMIAEIKQGRTALLDSGNDGKMKHSWPDSIKSILAVPMQNGEKTFGLIFAVNRKEKADFDNIDVNLFSSVAGQCAVFVENDHLFGDMKELFIGSLKALTNSIDAKDKYTRGHSERVAFISRWIAERYAETKPFDEQQIHKIYLAGLLHDIGKIGVDEAVLRKKGRLKEHELEQIRSHPRIGAAILNDIKQMKDIVPGVLFHHETPDGKGYPDGLVDKDIPFIARIIRLADAFDAMTSRRTYREAMNLTRATREIQDTLGVLFDEEVGRVFLESDIQRLWNIIHDGFIESWDYSNFAEYGTKAVGTLIRE